jgi:hypothetical protein
MSYDIFKQNMLSYMRNQRAIGSKEDFAAKLVQEYDALIKRGYDTVNGIKLQQGNPQLMYNTLVGVLNTAFQQSSGEHAILTNMGKAFQAYWVGVGELNLTPAEPVDEIQVDEEDKEESAAVKRDITVEYPKTQRAYEREFPTRAAALSHNKNVNTSDVVKTQNEIKNNEGPPPNVVVPGGVNKKDALLFAKCGNGHWPATGEAPNFDVQSVQGSRTWYKQNSAYIKANCTQILFPTSKGDKKITVHKDLAAVVQPALDEIRAKGLQQYIENCAGGLAVRNVTGGTRLSNHSWGTAIDMNTVKYPYGVTFKPDGIYKDKGKTKVRDLDTFDKGFQQVAAIFKSKGMTWLSNNDPMHVSIYE